MREILFRGFHPDENGKKTIKVKLVGHSDREFTYKGDWVYGLPFSRIGGGLYYDGINAIRVDDGKQNIFGVVAETVEQFSGRLDRNKTNIFEGDILDDNDGKPHYVCVFHNGAFGFYSIKEYLDEDFVCYDDLFDTSICTIIGNIYENKEIIDESNL